MSNGDELRLFHYFSNEIRTHRRQRPIPFPRPRRRAANRVRSLAVVAIKEETDKRIDEVADDVTWVGIGQLGKMISFFKKQGVTKAIMAGQVKHVQIFSGALPDVRMLKMLWNLPRRNTDALIGGVADEMAKEGIELIDSTYFIQDHLAPQGVLTKRKPTDIELGNIEYGLHIADEIARLDLGQTIVVRAKACVAIEAMEGTDATIDVPASSRRES